MNPQNEDDVHGQAMQEHLVSQHAVLVNMILRHSGVKAAKAQAVAAGITIWAIIQAILPFVLQFLTTGKIDWAAIIAAILALIPKA